MFAYNEQGEGLGSKIISNEHTLTFSDSDRIEVEHYEKNATKWLSQKEGFTSVGFHENPGHYPSGMKPHTPAWIQLAFQSKKTRNTSVSFNARASEGSQFEIWQGHHLVGRYSVSKHKDFKVFSAPASLIKSSLPLEIRLSASNRFELDWIEFE